MTLVVFGLLILLLVLSAPIAVALGVAIVFPSIIDPDFLTSQAYIVRSIFSGVDSTPLLAIPLFVFSGAVMAQGGISKKLFDICACLVGQQDRRHALCGDPHLPVLRRHLRLRPRHLRGGGRHGHPGTDRPGL